MKKKLNLNKGYSLVEMIIVIAIIVIMTAAAMITVTLLASARAKESGVTFESILSDTITKSKTQLVTMTTTVTEGGVDKTVIASYPTYGRCVEIYAKAGGKYYIKTGYYNPAGATDADKYIMDVEDTTDGTGLSKRVEITYKETGSTDEKKIEPGAGKLNKVYIAFDRSGKCVAGDGVFTFYKSNGNQVCNVTINKNGSHQSN